MVKLNWFNASDVVIIVYPIANPFSLKTDG